MLLPTQHDQRHIKQAKHNELLLKEDCFPNPCNQENLQYKDWNATIVFYAALHYLEAYLHAKGLKANFMSHRERNDYLKNVASIKDQSINKILVTYLQLYKLSRLARYNPCYYLYVRPRDLCKYIKFAFKELPKILKLST